MKLYKYRSMGSLPTDTAAFERLSDILHKRQFWCAAPASLNDPSEFIWTCDFTPTSATPELLAEVLVRFGREKTLRQAREMASATIDLGRLELHARPLIDMIVQESRNGIGVSCFGTSSNSPVMWQRYGGDGTGVCIEIDVPDELLNKQFYFVEYPPTKVLHVDHFLGAGLGTESLRTMYSLSLLSKTPEWADEAEIRFISKTQNVPVIITDSRISRLILGPDLDHASQSRVFDLIKSLNYELPLAYHQP